MVKRYDRKSLATAPGGRVVLVSTVKNALGAESAIFPANDDGQVTSALHLYKMKHRPEDGRFSSDYLDAQHEATVAAAEAGTISLAHRDATPEEGEEALGELILLAKMAEDQGIDGGAGTV